MEKYYLKTRWKLLDKTLHYYGMRSAPYFLKNTLKLSKKEISLINVLPKTLSKKEIKILRLFINQGILVLSNNQYNIPQNLEEAQFCKSCVANDYIIPGIEFNDQGLCPMCEHKEETRSLKSILPIKNTFEVAKHSRFDIALFYTGGKDSSYLLYYLSKVKKYRVLALTWEIPFMSESAIKSIENAKKLLKNVEFVTRKIKDDDLQKIYQHLYLKTGNTCACPSLAYMLFYPEMVAENVPYFVVGNEPVQLLNLYFNRYAPKIAFKEKTHRWMLHTTNLFRVLTLKKPLKMGQLHTLITLKQLAYGDPWFKRLSSYKHEILTHILSAIDEVPTLKKTLKYAIKKSSRSARIPAFVQIDFNDICEGHYDWRLVSETIKKEVGWVGPKESSKALHTSCQIEKCKDYSQFKRFYNMESKTIPFSAIEMSLASSALHLTKEEAMHEIKHHLGFSCEDDSCCAVMMSYLNKS